MTATLYFGNPQASLAELAAEGALVLDVQ